ncbi:hypothetical protein [Carnimonas nigrificans]|uniref:hypothetical protein n=1 Tax=Carnimonas nigrificans TaxID=64323 RepID=UPI00046FC2EE|nr:hypothetical protein [Carnimonas nigrificans]
MKISNVMIAATLAGSVALLAGCGGPEVVSDPNGQGIAQTQTITAYKNTTEGYTLNYPDVWHSLVSPEDTLDWGGNDLPAENVVVFNYTPAKPGAKPEPLVALAVYDQDQISQLEKNNGSGHHQPDVLATKDGKVLVAYSRGANPYDLRSEDGQQFSARALSTDQLKNAVSW